MAQRAKNPKKTSAQDGADDLSILNPDATLTIKDRTITVREYGFVEGLKLRPFYQPFLDDLYQVMVGDTPAELDAVESIITKHLEITLELIQVAADVDREFIESLNHRDGQALMDAWWQVNSPFFLTRVFKKAAQEKAINRAAGQTSTKRSSNAGTTRTESGGTPSGKSSSTTEPPSVPKTGKEANS